ncbi:hypothetical protein BDV59DRAFT_209394 [Aspergillus ambiguus]|uniref:putative SNF2 family helicase n=1 Tax=Aspergillus ambiguus TaxID=176160 RepID=UPI003CCE0848
MALKRKQPFPRWTSRPTKRTKHTFPQQGNPQKPSKSPNTARGDSSAAQPSPPESEIPEIVRSRPYSGPRAARTQLALSLPPLYNLSDIYKSISERALALSFDDFLAHTGSRALRVVTVCSGTESPLLALEMVQENLRKHFDRNFEFRHLFSAEIVPFKQAYIERNFHPRFIFRDVTELKDRVAETAYGSLEKIPKNADILIAGFSCVDFSTLNNKRKTLDDKGESGGTFWGIIRYARTYRPRMVILENVKTAPWDTIEKHWNEINYFAVHVDVDTKAYYIPQTRERGYMFCVDIERMNKHGISEEDILRWKEVLADFKRPASSPAGMFIMSPDDRRLEQIENNMAARTTSLSSSPRTTVNWAKYQVRHQSYRLNQSLGYRRPMMEGYDMNFKERCIELSQGLDREVDSRAYGIVGCITPCGIPYITTRGGPLCGLLLTRESQLAGAAVLSALIVGYKLLDRGGAVGDTKRAVPKSRILVPRSDCVLVPSNFAHTPKWNLADLQAQASSSARYCVILRCTLCGHTACSDCAGNPEHAYKRSPDLVRSQPLEFVTQLKLILPARLNVSGVTAATFGPLKMEKSIEFSQSMGDELRFLDIKRNDVWTVSYEGKYTILNLIIGHHQTDWFLYAKPSYSEPALCLTREILSRPFAHMTPGSTSLLDGDWEVCSPLSARLPMAKCGLDMELFRESQVWAQVEVIDIRGTYELLPDCGTANACLHKKAATTTSPPIYLFLDPTKLGEPFYDSFVFSVRLTIAEVSHTWRSSRSTQRSEVVNVYYRKWIKASNMVLKSFAPDSSISCSRLKPESTISISGSDCHNANITLLSFSSSEGILGNISGREPFQMIDPMDSPGILRELSWLLQKAATLSGFQDWTEVINRDTNHASAGRPVCTICVPSKPRLVWGRDRRGWIKAYEDPHDAALYERQVKSRPRIFLVFRVVEDNGMEKLQITLNVQTLLHQAHEKLRSSNVVGNASFCWRLVPNTYDSRHMAHPKFELKSNRKDYESTQPPGFQVSLRPEQLRSLAWMIKQEDDVVDPFIEEETEEALLPEIMWRAEARVTVPTTARGGLLADDVGYGKTAIILGLIDWQFERTKKPTSDTVSGFIPTNATLVVVPQIMLQQWQSEIQKFLSLKYNVLVFKTPRSLTSSTIGDIQNADIILVAWSIFKNPGYYKKLQKFTGIPQAPTKAGRNFDEWFEAALISLGDQVQILKEQGPEAFLDNLRAKRQEVKDKPGHSIYVPSRRLRGQQYADVYQARAQNRETNNEIQYAELSSADDSDNMDEEDPLVLRRKVDQFIKLRPQQSFGPLGNEGVSEDDLGSDTDSEDFSSETPTVKGKTSQRKGTKRERGQHMKQKQSKKWDDQREFNINLDGTRVWTDVKAPILHAFLFQRLVIDEFTYADSERLGPLLSLQARSKWVLSGTPPLNDFADMKTISPFLGIHLGVDEDDEQSQNKRLKALHRQRSDAETFQSFRTPRSDTWHRHRHEVAQRFLDQFARRNVAEIDEIPFTEHIVLVSQSPAESTIYLELYKQLMTCNRQLRRSSGRSRLCSDQSERLDEIISSSSTAEEALLKRCASLAHQGRWDKGKPESMTCKSLIEVREKQLSDLKDNLLMKLKMAACLYCGCDLRYESFHTFVESIIRHDFGDKEVTSKVYPLLKSAILRSRKDDWKFFFTRLGASKDEQLLADDEGRSNEKYNDHSHGIATRVEIPKEEKTMRLREKSVKSDQALLPRKPTKPKEYESMMREVTTAIRNLVVEWVLRERALRFLQAVRLVQSGSKHLKCDGCESQPSKPDEIHILGSCGHILCSNCVSNVGLEEECAIEGCRGSRKRFNIISASTLGYDKDRSTTYGGTKLDRLVQLIREIPENERVLLFIQFTELIDIASMALNIASVKHTVISAADGKSAQKIEQFQKTSFGENKVLILNLGSEMAAGLNLQCANHVIFLSPMLTQTQYDYDSGMVQAIGRCRRYGQTKHVHIYHLLAKRTIDVNIFQGRRNRILVERDGAPILVTPDEAEGSEAMSCQGPSLVVDNAF